jgi:hypothetical protein
MRPRLRFLLVAISTILRPHEGIAQLSRAVPVPKPVVDSAYRIVSQLLGAGRARSTLSVAPTINDFVRARTNSICTDANCLWPWRFTYYVVAFSFRPTTNSPGVGVVLVPLDTVGHLLPGYHAFGAPDCVRSSALCSFLSADSAQSIARKHGFKQGLHPWRIKFVWGEFPNLGNERVPIKQHFAAFGKRTYFWLVMNELTERGGEIFAIDATSGEVRPLSTWTRPID